MRTGPVAAVAVSGLVLAAGCGGGTTARTDVPEPAMAPTASGTVPGSVLSLPGRPEGMAFDPLTGILAVAVRAPGGLVLVDGRTGSERARVPLPGAARHLALAEPGGPVLVPTENNDRLYRVSLPAGSVLAEVPVGRQPHDAAVAAGGAVFVGDELADTVHVVAPDGTARVLPAPVQPGGVAASADGAAVVVVGVRGRRIEAFAPDGRSLGTAAAGVGPTHVEAGAGALFYVADTQGGAVLVFEVGPDGVRQVGRASTGDDAPYGLAVDVARKRVYVTLTGSNELRSFTISGRQLKADRTWPTVRQPNDVVVDPSSGRLFVSGTADHQLQVLGP